jgi:solute carrier family 25 protein 33/36
MQAIRNDTKDAALNAVPEKPLSPQVQLNSSWAHLVAGA